MKDYRESLKIIMAATAATAATAEGVVPVATFHA